MNNNDNGSLRRRGGGEEICLRQNDLVYVLKNEKYGEILMFNRALMWLKIAAPHNLRCSYILSRA